MSLETDSLLHPQAREDGAQSTPAKQKEKLGLHSTALLIFNRVIGTGIFATPSMILRASGSVGLSLVLWLLGALVASCGTAVFVELGTVGRFSRCNYQVALILVRLYQSTEERRIIWSSSTDGLHSCLHVYMRYIRC